MVGGYDLRNLGQEMLPREWSYKRQHDPQLNNQWSMMLRKNPTEFPRYEEMRKIVLSECKIQLI